MRERDEYANANMPKQTLGSKRSTDTLETNSTLNQMSETTQDVAYRRKVIMNALICSTESNLEQLEDILQEDHDDGKSLTRYLCCLII